MLPMTYPNSVYSFLVDKSQGLRLVFVSEALQAQARTQPTEPLWFIDLGDEESLGSMIRWVRFHRQSWNDWGKLGSAGGPALLATHMSKLLAEDPPAHSYGFTLNDSDEASPELVIGETVDNENGLGIRVYHRHAFSDLAHKRAFKDWLLSNNPSQNGEELLELALNKGTGALADKIDAITAVEVVKAAR